MFFFLVYLKMYFATSVCLPMVAHNYGFNFLAFVFFSFLDFRIDCFVFKFNMDFLLLLVLFIFRFLYSFFCGFVYFILRKFWQRKWNSAILIHIHIYAYVSICLPIIYYVDIFCCAYCFCFSWTSSSIASQSYCKQG